MVGEAPELPGFFVGAGFNAYGIAAAGGAGRALAEWIAGGAPQMDLWPVDIRRFGRHHRDARWVRARTLEAYAHHYTMHWPHEELTAGRPLRRSPLYERLRAAGACFGSKMGWERPNWFAPPGVEPVDVYTYGRPNWFAHVAAEHRATREACALFDESSFAKFMVIGRDAEAALSWICSADVRRPVGSCIYTEMLNDRGGIECDLTLTRLADDAFYVITGTGYATHDFDWIRRGIPAGLDARLVDVTSQRAVIGLMGPRSREVLAALAGDDADLSNDGFPFLTWRSLVVAGAELWALRITFVGELGYELHVPVELAATVYDALRQAGAPFGIRDAGYRAIESLRLEKGYRVWSADVTPDDTPLEAGLGWNVKLKTDTPFRGREALEAQQRAGVRRRLAQFWVDDPAVVLLGRETIYRDGERRGWLTSGGFGHTLGLPIGMGYVRSEAPLTPEAVAASRYELEVAGERVPAHAQLRPLFDPEGKRVRC
jgi:4-methylaminobutanoate oxidase (formaldehyde-forming)